MEDMNSKEFLNIDCRKGFNRQILDFLMFDHNRFNIAADPESQSNCSRVAHEIRLYVLKIFLILELLLSSTLCSSSIELFAANLMFLITLCSSIHEIGRRELVGLKLDWLENRFKVAFSRELIIYS